MRVRALRAGRIAHAALLAAGPVSIAPNRFQWIGDELVWIGWLPSAMHARVVQLEGPAEHHELDLGDAEAWQPGVAAPASSELLSSLENPSGYGKLLLGEPLSFPLSATVERVDALIEAYRLDSPERVLDAAVDLLGAGPGLTPSGDDLVAGSLYARRPFDAHWQAAADSIVSEAKSRTSRLSATLLADHVAGDTYEPVYDLTPAALPRLLSIGHSSGWDFFTGYAIGARWL